jgi:phage baseplate assembly protein W
MFKDIQTISTTVDELNAIKNSITNILLTKRGSLPGKPEFGSDLFLGIFGPIDGLQISVLKNFIRESLNEFEPRIFISDIIIKPIQEYNKIVINLYFSYKNLEGNNNDLISLTLNL